MEIVHSLPLTTCGFKCGGSRKIVLLEETADMRRNPAALHGRGRSYREQSRERVFHNELVYPLSYGVPVRERYGSTLLPATREQHDQNCTQSH